MRKKYLCYCFLLFIYISQFILIKAAEGDEDNEELDDTEISSIMSNLKINLTTIRNNFLSPSSNLEIDGGQANFFSYNNDFFYQISDVEKQTGGGNNIKRPQIKVSDNCLYKLENGHDNEYIVIEKIFRKFKTQKNEEAGIKYIYDIVYYRFYYVNKDTNATTNIDINKCRDKVTYYLPIYTEDNDALKNKYISVSGQNPNYDDEEKFLDYDIFDPNSVIYNDICATITYSIASESIVNEDAFQNYDITLRERRKYYFPGNTALCPKDFTYKGVDKNSFSSMCETSLKTYTVSGGAGEGYDYHKEFTFFNFDEKDFNKSKKDIYFSMDVLKCISLAFKSKGFKGNYGSYFMIVLIFIVVACYLILLLTGKYHLLSVLELLYNSNIKSMNYLKAVNVNSTVQNNSNQIIPYDIKSNNNLIASHQSSLSNGQLMSNMLSGNNYIYNPQYQNNDKLSMSKKSIQKNEKDKKTKNDLMSNVDEQENDYESEKGSEEKDNTNIKDSSNKDVDILKVKKKGKEKEEKNDKKEKEKEDKNNKKVKEKEKEDKKGKEKEKEEEESEEESEEDNDSEEESESNKDYKNKINKKKKIEDKESSNKSNPPKKSTNGKSDNKEEENGNRRKSKKSKNPIEISLNVKDLRDMMFKDQIPKSENIIKEEIKEEKKEEEKPKSKSKKNKKNNNNENNNNNGNNNNGYNNNMNMPNGYPFPPYIPPLGMMPYGMPPYQYPNNGSSPNNNNSETEKLKKELEYQRELIERKDREMRREREEMLERERERQRQREYDMDRERRLRDMEMMYNNNSMQRFENVHKKYKNQIKRGSALWNDDSDDIIMKEREKFYEEQDKYIKAKEKLEEEIKKKKEENTQIQKDLDLIKENQKLKEIEYEKELLKKNQELKEQFEKEKKEIIESKDREIQILREDKDREIQRLKEDKDREIELLKQDMQKEIKKKDQKIKKKEKVIEKQKRETVILKKDLTTNNTFYTNNIGSTLRQNNMDLNGYKKEEKIDAPQVVVSISSIFTDQELNAMDFEQSCQFDKRNLCQVYLSYVNRKQPLFFFFNYNSSSSGISIFQINYQSIRFIIICIDFMIYLFIYCTFFGTKSITYIYYKKFNFRRMCILGSIISPFCLIIRSLIHHFVYDPMNKKIAEIKMRCYTNFSVGKKKEELKVNEFRDFWESDGGEQPKNKEEFEKKEEIDDIQDIENDENLSEEEKMRRKDKYEKRRLKQLIKEVIALFQKKLLISSVIMILAMFFEWIYISSFCAVYKNSQLKFFVSILVCYGFANLIPFVYCLVPTIFKQDAVRDESKFSFFLASVFQMI